MMPLGPFVFAATLVSAVAAGTAAAAELAPHTALYRAHLADAAEGTGLVAAEGVMRYRIAETCDAWEVETKAYLRLHYDETLGGEVVESNWSFAATERKDGQGYEFEVHHGRGTRVLETFAGRAEIVPGKGGEAVFEAPENRRIALPAGSLFPSAHLARLLEAAGRGEPRVSRVVFDGASLENPYEVNAVLAGRPTRSAGRGVAGRPVLDGGKKLRDGEGAGMALARAVDLGDAPTWRMRLAFFPFAVSPPGTHPAVIPEFEIESDYRADGIAARILQDFGDFALEMTPARVERLKRPAC